MEITSTRFEYDSSHQEYIFCLLDYFQSNLGLIKHNFNHYVHGWWPHVVYKCIICHVPSLSQLIPWKNYSQNESKDWETWLPSLPGP